jgi:hypothetical protein
MKIHLILIGTGLCVSTCLMNAQLKTNSSGEYTAHKVGSNCTNSDCAVKIPLAVYLPLGAQVKAIHCFANIKENVENPSDYPHHELHPVTCGKDVSWSIFTTPVQQTTPTNVTVTTEYQNRSSDRDRDVRLDVDWTP